MSEEKSYISNEAIESVFNYKRFRQTVLDGLADGTLKISCPLTELDLAIQYIAGIDYNKGHREISAENLARRITLLGILTNTDFWNDTREYSSQTKPTINP